MEVSYKKDGNRKFLIVKQEKLEETDYKLQMVLNNKISGIVPMSIRNINNEAEIYYCTTSMISMESMFAQKNITVHELCEVIKNIKIISENMREYLLDINNIIFDMQFVFINRKSGKYGFCYFPNTTDKFQNTLEKFFEKILGYIDYKDKRSVSIAYGIQQITVQDDFTIQELLDYINNNMERDMRPQLETKQEQENFEPVLGEKQTGWNLKEKSKWRSIVGIITGKDKYITEEEIALSTCSKCKPLLKLRGINHNITIEITHDKLPCIIGKSKKNSDFFIGNSAISRTHIRIMETKIGICIEDLNSTNGTLVNGELLNAYEKKKINAGDYIKIANIKFVVESNIAK